MIDGACALCHLILLVSLLFSVLGIIGRVVDALIFFPSTVVLSFSFCIMHHLLYIDARINHEKVTIPAITAIQL